MMYANPDGYLTWALMLLAGFLLFTPLGGVAFQGVVSILIYAGIAIASIFDEDIRNDMNAIR